MGALRRIRLWLAMLGEGILAMFGTAAFVTLVVLLGGQIIFWLWSGHWHPLPVSLLFDRFDIDVSGLSRWREWKGVARMAQWALAMPLSVAAPLALLLTGIAIRSVFGPRPSPDRRAVPPSG